MRGRSRLLMAVLVLLTLAGCTLVGVPPRTPPPAEPSGGTGAGGADDAPPAAERPDAAARPGEPGGAGVPGEVRALWVVRTTLTHPDSVRALVRRADRAGFNTLLVQVRGRGDAYYDSRLEPRAAALADQPPGFDPLALVLREARARGLAVHAWVNAHLVNGVGSLAEDPRHVVRARPELLAVPRPLARELYHADPADPTYARALLRYARAHRDQVEGIYTSPASPRVKEHLRAVWTDLVESYDLDGLHLDYVRYPSRAFDYSRPALESFRRWARSRLPDERAAELERAHWSDPLAYVEALPEAWDDFRRAQIDELVRSTYHQVKARRPDMIVSAAVRADVDDARRQRFQDWTRWLEEGVLDAAAPMAYTDDDRLFGRWIEDAAQEVGGERIWAGIGVYRTDFPGTLSQIGIARERGVGGLALFSYDWAVAEARSDRPDVTFLQRVGQEAFGGALAVE